MTCPTCGGTLEPATFYPDLVRCVGHYCDGRLMRGGCGYAGKREDAPIGPFALLCMEHAIMVEALRELSTMTEPEPWESGSPEHKLATRTLTLVEDGLEAGVGS